MGIRIITDREYVVEDGWSFNISELDYLLEEHDDKTFVLFDDRLYETNLDEDMGEITV